MQILLIRHTETTWNKNRLIPPLLAGNLTKLGKSQIGITLTNLKKFKFDHIFSSDSERCVLLARELSLKLNKGLTFDPLLREINNPSLEGKSVNLVKSMDNSSIYSNGDELPSQVELRVRKFIKKLKFLNLSSILIVSHSFFIKSFIKLSSDIVTPSIKHIKPTEVYIVDI